MSDLTTVTQGVKETVETRERAFWHLCVTSFDAKLPPDCAQVASIKLRNLNPPLGRRMSSRRLEGHTSVNLLSSPVEQSGM